MTKSGREVGSKVASSPVQQSLEGVLDLTEAMERDLQTVLAANTGDGSPRSKICGAFIALALQHWTSIRVLFEIGNRDSAIALLRCQFECTIKAFWVAFSASDSWIEKSSTVRLRDDGQVAEPAKSRDDMLDGLENKAPAVVVAQLRQFKVIAWRQMNSYIHSGMHPLATSGQDLPEKLLVQLLKNSNGLAALLATLSAMKIPALMHAVINVQMQYKRCLPLAADSVSQPQAHG